MAQLWFLAAPPLGPQMYQGICQRIGGGIVLDSAEFSPDYRRAGQELAERIQNEKTPIVLVAHGLALPMAIMAAQHAPLALLVLSNGPITRLDPVTAALAQMASRPGGPALLSATLFQPRLWIRYLASSLGLRRLVANPYVMDRDTVATLASPALSDYATRQHLAARLSSLNTGLPDVKTITCPVRLIWGDADPLYPGYEADYIYSALSNCTWERIPGAQHLHPWERPWELADRLVACIQDLPIRSTSDKNVADT